MEETKMYIPAECKCLRIQIEEAKEAVMNMKEVVIEGDYNCSTNNDKGEMIANITLAYRHLEDAKMRIGKVIQAFGNTVTDVDLPDRDQV